VHFWISLLLIALLLQPASAQAQAQWAVVSDPAKIIDDDLARHASNPAFLDGISLSETRFSEAGFNWHLLRFVNTMKPVGPLWAVPHDNENAAFEAAIDAVKTHGGVAIMVNSGFGSSRTQSGRGTCGGRSFITSKCDPNRNFSDATPLYTKAFIDQLPTGQPIIALHTNMPGFGSGNGHITILDEKAANQGTFKPRPDGYFGIDAPLILQDYDSYAIMPYLQPYIAQVDILCRTKLVAAGIHVLHERVTKSDGSFSNFIVLTMPEVRYINMESKREDDLNVAAERHRLMVNAYLNGCFVSGN
jgi:hypothetical protein